MGGKIAGLVIGALEGQMVEEFFDDAPDSGFT
jgi:hypothetical protein